MCISLFHLQISHQVIDIKSSLKSQNDYTISDNSLDTTVLIDTGRYNLPYYWLCHGSCNTAPPAIGEQRERTYHSPINYLRNLTNDSLINKDTCKARTVKFCTNVLQFEVLLYNRVFTLMADNETMFFF